MATYHYSAFTEPDSFRIILLEPSLSADSPIQCTLLHTTLSECDREIIDHYTALSYVWGDATQRATITVSGAPFNITATLHAALKALRDTTRTVRVWADALCINQNDNDEKAVQVALMAQIYSTAHHTVIYLGPKTTAAETVLTIAPSNTTGHISSSASWLEAEQAGDELLQLAWFSRVWIFQELVLSSDPWIQMGDLRARWTDVVSILLSDEAQSIKGTNATRRKMLQDMNASRFNKSVQILDLLLSRRGLGATNPRDMVYAHWSMASDRSQIEKYVIIDYDQTCEEIYEHVARYLLDHVAPNSPDTFFQHLDDRDASTRREGLASWAPDWTIAEPRLEEMYQDNLLSTRRLNAKDHYVFVGNPLVLAYIGYQVDVVADTSLACPPSAAMHSGDRQEYQKAVKALQAFYREQGGVWWSGDANGRYRHISLKDRERQHEKLCLQLADEWAQIMQEDLPELSTAASASELDSHRSFTVMFETWLQERATQGLIMAGSDSDHIESLMFRYLYPGIDSSVIAGRRFFSTKSGRIGITSKHTKPGDIAVYFAGSSVTKVIRKMRRQDAGELEQTVKDAFMAKQERERDQNDDCNQPMANAQKTNEVFASCALSGMSVQSGIVIGDCYIEGVVGWLPEPKEEHEYTIFALR